MILLPTTAETLVITALVLVVLVVLVKMKDRKQISLVSPFCESTELVFCP